VAISGPLGVVVTWNGWSCLGVALILGSTCGALYLFETLRRVYRET
jgi:hypothetical protein